MQSLSLRTAILIDGSLKIAVGEMHSQVPGKREQKDSKRVGHRLQCRIQSSPSWHPMRHPGFSSAVWNLAAVHRPLHAIRNAPHHHTSFTSVVCPTQAFHEGENTMLVDETTRTIGAAANGCGDVKDVTTLVYQGVST